MTKTELVKEISRQGSLSKADAEKSLNSFITIVTNTLRKGDKVTIPGFGTFEVANRKARTGINPATKEKIKIKASKAPKFKPGKTLKDAVQR